MIRLVIVTALLAGCASLPSEQRFVGGSNRLVFRDTNSQREIVLDLAHLTIERDGRSTSLVDCSTGEYFCLRAEDWFAFAFPKICPSESERDRGLHVGGLVVELRAPTLHRPPGSGLYFSRSVPGGQFQYDSELGLTALTFSSVSPVDPAWRGPDIVYSRVSLDRSPPLRLMACSPRQ